MSSELGNIGLLIRAHVNPHLWDNPDDPGGRVLKGYSKARTSAVLYCICCSFESLEG